MKLLDILKCARPVLFLNADPAYPVSVGGSAFIVKFRGRHFVVTAKHVLRAGGFEPSQARIQYRPDFNVFVPTREAFWLHSDDADDTDQFDVAIWSLDENSIDPTLFGDYLPYNLLGIDASTIYGGNSHYLFRGYPSMLRDVDYQTRNFQLGSISGRALYVGPAAAAFTHEVALVNDGTLASAEGLSGSPVFQVNNNEDDVTSNQAFAGVLVRGNAVRAYFLEHRRIIETLVRICDDDSQSQKTSYEREELPFPANDDASVT